LPVWYQNKIAVCGIVVELSYDFHVLSPVSNCIGATDFRRTNSLIDFLGSLRLTNEIRVRVGLVERGEKCRCLCFRSTAPETIAAPSSGRIGVDMMTGELPGCVERSVHVEWETQRMLKTGRIHNRIPDAQFKMVGSSKNNTCNDFGLNTGYAKLPAIINRDLEDFSSGNSRSAEAQSLLGAILVSSIFLPAMLPVLVRQFK
jgi:hypothetical protein